MPSMPDDRRTWTETDRPGERISVALPRSGIEVTSVSGSKRHWRQAHDGFTLAIIHRNQPGLVADWRTRGRSLSAASGDIMAIEPGDLHVTRRLSFPEGGADFDIVRFTPELVSEAARELGMPTDWHFKSPLTGDVPAFDALQALVETVARSDDALEVEAAGVAAALAVVSRLAEAPPRFGRASHPIADYRLRRLRDCLHEHLDKRPTLAELETVAQLSRYRLCVVFKQAFGASIGTYWRALRANDAARRLLGGVPVKMIVSLLGYADEAHFSREFKAHLGLAPGRWLALYRASGRSPAAPRLRRAPGQPDLRNPRTLTFPP